MKLRIKMLCPLFLGLFMGIKSFGQDTKQVVKISNIDKKNGDLYIGWYNDPKSFRINEKAIYREKIVVNNQTELTVVFKNIPGGKYAIAVFLDENGNYELDRNIFGIPEEKYGFSNNILPALRPATFEESIFEINKSESLINIKLK